MLPIALVALLAAPSPPTAHAGDAVRPRWGNVRQIPVWIEKTPPFDRERELVRRALQAWSAASDGTVLFREVEEFPSNGIRVRFAAREGYFGEAVPHTAAGQIVRADVLLSADITGDDQQRQVVTYLTALHEVGHALGLDHTRKFETAMYQFRQPTDPERYFQRYRSQTPSADGIGMGEGGGLSTADVKALRRLYGP